MKTFEEYLSENEKLIKTLAKKYKSNYPNLEYDDLEQTAMISYWNAYETYSEGTAAFGSYAYLVIDRDLGKYVRNNLFYKKKCGNKYNKYVKKPEKKEGGNYAFEYLSDFSDLGKEEMSKLSVNEEIDADLMIEEMVVNEQERRCLKMKYEGYTIREIAKVIGKSKTTVDRVLKNIGERNLRIDPELELTRFSS